MASITRKRLLASALASMVAFVSLIGYLEIKSDGIVPILMYHAIEGADKNTKLSVSAKSFASEMEFLSKHQYTVVGLDSVVGYMQKREAIPPKTVAITFDDGYDNNYRYAFPVLKKYRIHATIFIITDRVGTPGYLGWNEIREMSESGLVTIGSHTKSHPWLPSLSREKIRDELAGSKAILEKALRKRIDFFCYPAGAFDGRVQEIAREVGYKAAVTTNPKKFKPVNDIYAIKRIKISPTSDNLAIFWVETTRYYAGIKERR